MFLSNVFFFNSIRRTSNKIMIMIVIMMMSEIEMVIYSMYSRD